MARIGADVNPLAPLGSPTVAGQNRQQARSRDDARKRYHADAESKRDHMLGERHLGMRGKQITRFALRSTVGSSVPQR